MQIRKEKYNTRSLTKGLRIKMKITAESWSCKWLVSIEIVFSHCLCSSYFLLRNINSESRSVMSDSLGRHGVYSPWNSPDQNTGVGSLSLLQGIFPTQGLNPSLLLCRWILYQLSHKGSPWTQEWLAYSFSSRSSWPRIQTRVSYIAGGFFTNWDTRDTLNNVCVYIHLYLSMYQLCLA